MAIGDALRTNDVLDLRSVTPRRRHAGAGFAQDGLANAPLDLVHEAEPCYPTAGPIDTLAERTG
jgi:hypothetical protein